MFEPTGEVRSPHTGELYLFIASIFRHIDNVNSRHSQWQKKQVYT